MRLFVSAGEISGDRMLAAILDRLAKEYPGLELQGLGGPASARRGLRSLFPLEKLALNGILDVALSAVFCLRLYRTTVMRMVEFRPDLVLLVDYPGLNLRLLREAVKRGYRVHYVSPPQWWVYRDVNRRMRRHGAYLAQASLQTLYACESAPYAQAGMPVSTGHFLEGPPQPAVEGERDLEKAVGRCLLLLPGSRPRVMRRNLPEWLASLPVPEIEGDALPLKILLPDYLADQGRKILAASGRSGEILTDRDEAFSQARMALAFPGTITLELAMAGIPAAVAAVVDAITIFAAKRVLRQGPLALPNRILGRMVFPEWVGRSKHFSHDALRGLLEKMPSLATAAKTQEQLQALLGPPRGVETAFEQCRRLLAR